MSARPVSRYRSQRIANADNDAEEVPDVPSPPPAQQTQEDEGLVRSKSRYKRRSSVGGQRTAPVLPDEPSPQLLPAYRQSPPGNGTPTSPGAARHAGVVAPSRDADGYGSPPPQFGARDVDRNWSDERVDIERRDRQKVHPSVKRAKYPSPPSPSHQQQTVPPSRHGQSVPHTSTPPPRAIPATAPAPKPQTSTADLWPPPKPEPPKFVDGPPTSENIAATKLNIKQPAYEFEKDEGNGGCFGLFKRKRSSAALQEKTPIARNLTKGEHNIVAGGGKGGVVPGVDAPVSAVNAGDRRVLIECGKSRITLPVTPTTTPVDLIKSASIVMSEKIDVKSAVLLEHFGTVGVQRPLRRYEHIRDVMNSWDTDRQNSLLLVDPGIGSSETELTLAGVPREKPLDSNWVMFFSQKPGKWDKRVIIMRNDGQIMMQKDPNKPKDLQNICHLSDFDIYTPDQVKVRKKIKPPKRYCYAIKSQQKTSMFESTQNFVHFFCIGDKPTADSFYHRIQSWRSWYLVHVMGEGSKAKPVTNAQEATEARDAEVLGGNDWKRGHSKGDSLSSHYQLGSFQPLLDIEQFDRPATSKGNQGFNKSASQFDTTMSPERRKDSTRRKYPPVALDRAQLDEDEPLANLERKRSVNGRRQSNENRSPLQEEFADTGLLGRNYSQRRKEHDGREMRMNQPFTNGPNLLNGGIDERDDDFNPRRSIDVSSPPRREKSQRAPRKIHHASSSGDMDSSVKRGKSTRNASGGTQNHDRGASIDLQRSRSTKQRHEDAWGKPLIDLTPQYREPPQHVRKGHGHKPDALGPGRLIDAATSPDDPLGIPPSTDWRGRNAASPQQDPSGSRIRARSASRHQNHARSHSQQRPATSRGAGAAADYNDAVPVPDVPFTGEGLLAGSRAGWGGGAKGRGVMDGSHARGPMIDVSEQSKFAQGSLLNRVEREHGGPLPVPIIDRERNY